MRQASKGGWKTGVLFLLTTTACGPGSSQQDAASRSAAITDRDWQLTALGDQTDVLGAGQRSPTLRLESQARAAGFAGCNSYGSDYILTADSLVFGAIMSTKMACAEGDAVERRFLTALAATTQYELRGAELVLSSAGTPVATFRSP